MKNKIFTKIFVIIVLTVTTMIFLVKHRMIIECGIDIVREFMPNKKVEEDEKIEKEIEQENKNNAKKVSEKCEPMIKLFPTENLENFFNIEGPNGEKNGNWIIIEEFHSKEYKVMTKIDVNQKKRTIEGTLKVKSKELKKYDDFDKFNINVPLIYVNGKLYCKTNSKKIEKFITENKLLIQNLKINLQDYELGDSFINDYSIDNSKRYESFYTINSNNEVIKNIAKKYQLKEINEYRVEFNIECTDEYKNKKHKFLRKVIFDLHKGSDIENKNLTIKVKYKDN